MELGLGAKLAPNSLRLVQDDLGFRVDQNGMSEKYRYLAVTWVIAVGGTALWDSKLGISGTTTFKPMKTSEDSLSFRVQGRFDCPRLSSEPRVRACHIVCLGLNTVDASAKLKLKGSQPHIFSSSRRSACCAASTTVEGLHLIT